MFKIQINNFKIFLFTDNIICEKVFIELIRKYCSKTVHIEELKS